MAERLKVILTQYSLGLSLMLSFFLSACQITQYLKTNSSIDSLKLSSSTSTLIIAENSTNQLHLLSATSASMDYELNWSLALSGAGNLSRFDKAQGTVKLLRGQSTTSLELKVLDDLLVQGTENYVLTISGASLQKAITVQIQVADDESSPILSVSGGPVLESAGTVTLTFSLSSPAAQDVKFDWSTASQTATSGSDFSLSGETQALLPQGQTSITRNVVIHEDSIYEGNETFQVSLANVTGATMGTSPVSITIQDNETSPSLAIANASVLESTASIGVVVTRTGNTALPALVDYTTSDATALNIFDYTTTSGTLSIPANQTQGIITIPITADVLAEADETFTVTLSNPSNATIGTATSTVTITNEDVPTISGILPTSGPDFGGTSVTISGSGFLSGATVSLGSSACTAVNVVTSSQITCTTPAGTVGATDVTVTNSLASQPSGTRTVTSSNAFTHLASSWNFGNPGDFAYDSNHFATNQALNLASLTPLSLTQDDLNDFNGGTYVNTQWSSGKLTLTTALPSPKVLASSWTPKWTNLKGYWKFENDWQDVIGSSHGTATGGATFSAGSQLGSAAALFDGVDDKVTIPDNNDFDLLAGANFSVSLWVYPTRLATQEYLIEKRDGGVFQFWDIFKRTNNTICFEAYSSVGWNPIGVCVEPQFNQWNHIVFTKVGATVTGFLKGTQRVSVTDPIYNGDMSNGDSLRLGRRVYNDWPFAGHLDDLAIWNTNLTPSEVKYLYERQNPKFAQLEHDSSWTPQWANLVGHWPLNGDFKSRVGAGLDGVANGNATATATPKLGTYSATFDGNGDFALVPYNAAFDLTNELTLSVWIKTAQNASDLKFIIGRYNCGGGTCSGFGLMMADAASFGVRANQVGFMASGSWVWTGVPVNTGTWTHIAATYDRATGQTSSMYLNGVKVGSICCSNLQATATALSIGTLLSLPQYSWNGEIDEVALWNKALTASEIETIYLKQSAKFGGS